MHSKIRTVSDSKLIGAENKAQVNLYFVIFCVCAGMHVCTTFSCLILLDCIQNVYKVIIKSPDISKHLKVM